MVWSFKKDCFNESPENRLHPGRMEEGSDGSNFGTENGGLELPPQMGKIKRRKRECFFFSSFGQTTKIMLGTSLDLPRPKSLVAE